MRTLGCAVAAARSSHVGALPRASQHGTNVLEHMSLQVVPLNARHGDEGAAAASLRSWRLGCRRGTSSPFQSRNTTPKDVAVFTAFSDTQLR